MRITVFERTVKAQNGSTFPVYSTKLVNRVTGEEIYPRVRFQKVAGIPDAFPCIIDVEKGDANLAKRTWEAKGKSGINYTLWVKAWKDSGEEYVDHSLDAFGDELDDGETPFD